MASDLILGTFWDSLRHIAEFLLCFRPCPPPPKPAGAFIVSDSVQEAFNIIDVNGDGRISPRELGDLLQKLGYDERAAMREAQEVVREMDANGDGWVDLPEFVEAVGNRSRSEDDLVAMAFGVYDADGKGLISAEDVRSVLKRFGLGDHSVERCRVMIEAVDRDGDGFVNLEEFRFLFMS